MAHPSPADLLVLHAVRLKGFADTAAVAARFDLDTGQTRENLLDAQAQGRVSRSSFADLTGWSLTETGYRHNEAQLLAARLGRFAGYHDRFTGALARAGHDPAWITGIEVDSCHRFWFEFHEDLIATLGLTR